MDDAEREHLQANRATQLRRLRLLQQQQSRRGSNTPPEIVMEIEDLHASIAEIEEQLGLDPAERLSRRSGQAAAAQTPARSIGMPLLAGILVVGVVALGGGYWFFQGRSGAQPNEGAASATSAGLVAPVATQQTTAAPASTQVGAGEPPTAAAAGGAATVAAAGVTTGGSLSISEPVNITNTPRVSDAPELVYDRQGNLHLMWREFTESVKGLGDLFYRQMNASGAWSDPLLLTGDFAIMLESDRLLERGDAGMCGVWSGATVATDPDTIGLYMRCQEDGGWSAPEMVAQPNYRARYAPAFTPDGTLHTIYETPPDSIASMDFELTDRVKTATFPRLAADTNGGLHAVWERQGQPFSIEYRFSGDGGKTWSDPQRLSDDSSVPSVAIELVGDRQGRVHLAWSGATGQLFYRRWQASSGWTDIINLRGAPTNGSTSLGLAVGDDGLARLAWQGDGVYFSQQASDDSWSNPVKIADGINPGPGPAIAIDQDGRSHVVYQVEDDTKDLFYVVISQ